MLQLRHIHMTSPEAPQLSPETEDPLSYITIDLNSPITHSGIHLLDIYAFFLDCEQIDDSFMPVIGDTSQKIEQTRCISHLQYIAVGPTFYIFGPNTKYQDVLADADVSDDIDATGYLEITSTLRDGQMVMEGRTLKGFIKLDPPYVVNKRQSDEFRDEFLIPILEEDHFEAY